MSVVYGEYSKRRKKHYKVCITQLIIIQMKKMKIFFYLPFMGLTKPKTISRYCPFNEV
jgi:hypothetical protein